MTHVASMTAATPNDGTQTSLAVPNPSGTLLGHTLIVDFLVRGPTGGGHTDNPVTLPAGWTLIDSLLELPPNVPYPTIRMVSAFRRYLLGDVTTRNFTWTHAANAVAVISAHFGLADDAVPAGEKVFVGKPGFSYDHVSGELTTTEYRILRSVFADRVGSTMLGGEDDVRGSVRLVSDCSLYVQETPAPVAPVIAETRSMTTNFSTSQAIVGFYALRDAPVTPGWEHDIGVVIG